MLDEDQVAILRAIGSSIAFDDDKKGKVTQLVLEGYVLKDGDLYELTPKGNRILEERGCVSGAGKIAEEQDSEAVARLTAQSYIGRDSREHASWRDVIVELTRTAPFVMLGVAFIAGAVFSRRR